MSTPTTATATTLPHYRPRHYPQYSHTYNEQQQDQQKQQEHYHHQQNPPSSRNPSASTGANSAASGSVITAPVSASTVTATASGLSVAATAAVSAASDSATASAITSITSITTPSVSAGFSAVAARSSVPSPLPTATAAAVPILPASTSTPSSTTFTSSSFENTRSTSIVTSGSAAAILSAAPAIPATPTTTVSATITSSNLPCLNPNNGSTSTNASSTSSNNNNSAIPSSAASSISLSSRLLPPYRSLPKPYLNGYHSHSINNIRSHDYENYDYDYSSHNHHHSTLLQSPVHAPAHMALSQKNYNHNQNHTHAHSHNSAYNAYTDLHISHQSQIQIPVLSPAQQHQKPYSPLGNSASGSSTYTAPSAAASSATAAGEPSELSVTLPPLSSLPSVPALSGPNHHRLGHISTATASPPNLSCLQSQTMATTSQSSQSQSQSQLTPARKRRRSREPDWTDFYKNGLPKEIIVIDDDSPENGPIDPVTLNTSNTVSMPLPHHPQTQNDQQATKRRKRDDEEAVYDALYHNTKYSASHTTTPRLNATPMSHSDRASALLNSSATSLSAHDLEIAQSGQKRKRATRQQIAHEARLKEAEIHLDSLVPYVPPPYPPRKAPDVHIRVVHDHYHRNHKVDDDDGHYIVVPEGELTERYQIVKLLGQGTFGKVVQAKDRRRNKLVAIKIIRSVQKYRDASKIELRVLATLKANDEENRNRCIHLRDCFDFRNHICIVMDLLGQSVFDFLKSNSFVPFPNSQIQSFARQLFTSVAFLHDLNLIHTDLKPENILLCDNTYQTFTYNRKIPSASCNTPRQANQRRVLLDTEIRLIDFGSATFQDEYHSSVVSTRHYRAPEIILGLGWSYPCDIWSIGCILVEFFTGDALFQTHDNLEHLAMMEAVVGNRIDSSLVQAVNRAASRSAAGNPASKFFKRLRLDFPTPETSRTSRRFVKAMKTLEDIIPANNAFLKSFLNLLRQIFVYDPAKRITAKAALQHPWFRELPNPDDGTEALKIRAERMRIEQLSRSTSASVSHSHMDNRTLAPIRP
ncbi:serine threonine protein kinase CMGC group [Ceratocystis pirilliformis]|uniref:Serine threonine protein kinase CMGC group n=1 Tax=Ceratocystis pirilliformis TaxID=259994 RepID=A0ABR3ZP33_9PEZI